MRKLPDGNKIITMQEEKFIQEVLKGKTQREAYLIAFPENRLTDSSINSRACKLWGKFKNSEIIKEMYIKNVEDMKNETIDVIEEIRTDTIATMEEVLSEITNIAFGKKRYPAIDMYGAEMMKGVNVPQRVKALDMLARYYKLYDGNNANSQSDGVLPELLKYLKKVDL